MIRFSSSSIRRVNQTAISSLTLMETFKDWSKFPFVYHETPSRLGCVCHDSDVRCWKSQRVVQTPGLPPSCHFLFPSSGQGQGRIKRMLSQLAKHSPGLMDKLSDAWIQLAYPVGQALKFHQVPLGGACPEHTLKLGLKLLVRVLRDSLVETLGA